MAVSGFAIAVARVDAEEILQALREMAIAIRDLGGRHRGVVVLIKMPRP
jgi:hypothetical protein